MKLLKKLYNFITNNIVRLLAVATNIAALTPTEKDDKAVELVSSVYDRLAGKKDKE